MSRSATIGIFLLLIFIIAARIFILNLSDYYVSDALEGNTESIDKALSWYSYHDKALYLKAKSVQPTDDRHAMELLARSILSNPSDMRALVIYADILGTHMQYDRSDHLMDVVSELMPANKSTRLRSAAYWLKRERLDKSIADWSMALSISAKLEKQLFPVFLRIAESDKMRVMLNDIVSDPPSWWESFFSYLTIHGKRIETLIEIADMRHRSSTPLSGVERKSLLSRLITESKWQEAYLIWAGGMSEAQRTQLGSIYDGGFELSHQGVGFDWRITNTKHFVTRFQYIYDSVGRKSLHVRFLNKELPYKNISQYLFLAKGKYQFSAIKRTDMLAGRGRLKWMVRCADNMNEIVGESPSVVPSKKWSKMKFIFTIPDSKSCRAQIIRLETTGKHAYDHKLTGSAWFDSLSIKRMAY